MANAWVHSQSSVKKFGGKAEDYMAIHQKMDCSKSHVSDNRHRALTHTMFWVNEVMVPLFGYTMINSDNRVIAIKDICERHILEDFHMKFIPTAQDYIEHMEFKDWMQNGIKGHPSSYNKISEKNSEKNSDTANVD